MRVGADVGGTFTDVVVDTPQGRIARKVPSTPGRFEKGVVEGSTATAGEAAGGLTDAVDFRHGTTVATNAVLERVGPRTGLVTTEGFRDVLELGRLRTPALYDLAWKKPPPLAPRRFRIEIAERMAADGIGCREPDLEGLRPSVDLLISGGVTTIAVSLLNAYANPLHEQQVAEWLRREYPDVHVTVATDVVREIGEYERTSTAVLNAYLQPVVSGYLGRLADALVASGCTAPVLVMQSSGGMTPVSDAARYPAHILESGPAAGVLAAASVARAAELPRAVSFDMGGTTAKASLIEGFSVSYANEFSVGSDVSSSSQLLKGGGYTVHLPVVDLAEVGAGGGSIAAVDAAGSLQVGPRSAGADPGPACYGRGGQQATVTDANLILGYLNAEGLRAGGIFVDVSLARKTVAEQVANPLGLSVEEAALAVHAVANRQMARVLRAVTTERGHDIGEQTLIAFGGSGPLHAATLAETVGISRVVVPPLAGVFSAVGLLDAPVQLTLSHTVSLPLGRVALLDLQRAIGNAGYVAAERYREAGLPDEGATVEHVLDLRYQGQASELSLPVPSVVQPDDVDELAARFQRLHERAYSHTLAAPIEVVRVRTTLAAAAPPAPASRVRTSGPNRSSTRPAVFGGPASPIATVERAAIAGPVPGPLLVDDSDTTTVVPPDWSVGRDDRGNLILERR